MAPHTEFVELLFDNVLYLRVGLVTVETHAHSSVVDIVVVATDARLINMVRMREVDRQHISFRVGYEVLGCIISCFEFS